MKKLFLLSLSVLFFSCNQQSSEKCKSLESAQLSVEKNIDTYKTAWEAFFDNRDPSAVNLDSFDENVTVVTAEGNITGIDGFRDYYNNYLTGFSDAEFSFVDVFAQGRARRTRALHAPRVRLAGACERGGDNVYAEIRPARQACESPRSGERRIRRISERARG